MRHVTSFSGRLAVGIAAVATLLVGASLGNPGIAVGVAGALAFGWGAGALDTDSNRRRAAGSVTTVGGGLAVLAGMGTAGPDVGAFTISAVALLGLAAVAVDASAGLGDDTLAPVLASLGSSIATVIAGVAAASLLHVAVGMGLVLVVLFGVGGWSLSTPLGAFVALQLQALLVGVLMGRARGAVESWFPGGVPVDAWEEFEPLAVTVDEVPRSYWLVLGLQVLALVLGGNVVVELLLGATWLFGDAVAVTLQSGVLHGALLLVLLVEGAVLFGELARGAATTALSPNPPKSLSYGAGGIALCVLVPLATGGAALASWLLGPSTDLTLLGGTWAAAAAVLALAVVALGVVFAIEVTGVAIAERGLLPDRASGFAIGATLLFVAAIAVVPAKSAPTVTVFDTAVTFVGVAAALVTWDLGENAVDLGSHLGPATETRRAEVVHATGSLAVAAAGAVLAMLSVVVLGPLQVPGSGRAVAALGLSLVALLAFVLALDRRPDA
jgi:hypothetical protein